MVVSLGEIKRNGIPKHNGRNKCKKRKIFCPLGDGNGERAFRYV